MLQPALPLPVPWNEDAKARLTQCLKLAATDAPAAAADAAKWQASGGSYFARQCLGVALANQQRWTEAATAFEAAAKDADAARDLVAADCWAKAGNAWLAAGEAEKARGVLDAAIASGGLVGNSLGEAYLDRARARVASGDSQGARDDLDEATLNAPDDALGWLLQATLSRRVNDLLKADKAIREALRLAPGEPSIQLEAGNVAAMRGDEPGARAAWSQVIELAPGTPIADAARNALSQFGAEK
ncbi:MAG: tetratricopeptide repeat protein [Sphingomonas sp.]|nr:tetratricopeptide repeat protein [Sphingomonas sp.]